MIEELEKITDKLNNKSKQIRHKLFGFILKSLDKMHFSGDSLSLIKILFGISYLLLVKTNLTLALILLIIGLLSDLFDGALARYQNKASDRGKFVDMISDAVIFAMFIWGLILLNKYDNQILSYNLVILPITYLIAIINKNERKETDWIIKPVAKLSLYKFFIELTFILNLFFDMSTHSFNNGLLIINIFISLHFTYHFLSFIYKKN